jgi:hypothetical protein
MNIEQLKKLCGVCGNEHSYSDAVCEESLSACGACGELSNPNSHNCSEETQLVTCANCLTDFSPFSEGYVSNSPHLGGTCAFCGECWKVEFIRRNARSN